MFLIVPLGGHPDVGRFKDGPGPGLLGYPKALVPVDGKPILYWLLDNLQSKHLVDFIYVPYGKEYISFDIEAKLKKDYPSTKFKFLILDPSAEKDAESGFECSAYKDRGV